MKELQLDRLVQQLEGAFGEVPPFSSGELSAGQVEVLGQVFGDEGYQHYLQDQVSRQVIRDYIVNAVMLGFLPERAIAGISAQVATPEGRAALSLHMVMSSVEQAAELVASSEREQLSELNPGLKLPPYMKLIDNE